MSDIKTLREELPKEITRVRDEVLPAYVEIGSSGTFAVLSMKAAIVLAEKAIAEGDTVMMLQCYQSLKGYNT